MSTFGDYSYYYNAFYQDKDYAKEAREIDRLLQRYGNHIEKVILYGCGTGNHDRELAKIGYSCHGIDMSEQMISQARETVSKLGLDIEYEVADIRAYRPSSKYDAVLSLFHVMSYQTSNEDTEKAFRSARQCLDPGGVFLFDAWYGPGVLSDKPVVRIKRVQDEKYRLIRLAEPEIFPNDNIVNVNYEVLVIDQNSDTVKTIKETHRMRYFFKPEIEECLKKCGFHLDAVLDEETQSEADFSSWTCYFVAHAV